MSRLFFFFLPGLWKPLQEVHHQSKNQTAADIKARVDNLMLHLLLVRKVYARDLAPDGFPVSVK